MSGINRGIGVAAYTEMCGMAPSRRLAASGFDRGGWRARGSLSIRAEERQSTQVQ